MTLRLIYGRIPKIPHINRATPCLNRIPHLYIGSIDEGDTMFKQGP